jgi:hypothetical protein
MTGDMSGPRCGTRPDAETRAGLCEDRRHGRRSNRQARRRGTLLSSCLSDQELEQWVSKTATREKADAKTAVKANVGKANEGNPTVKGIGGKVNVATIEASRLGE